VVYPINRTRPAGEPAAAVYGRGAASWSGGAAPRAARTRHGQMGCGPTAAAAAGDSTTARNMGSKEGLLDFSSPSNGLSSVR